MSYTKATSNQKTIQKWLNGEITSKELECKMYGCSDIPP